MKKYLCNYLTFDSYDNIVEGKNKVISVNEEGTIIDIDDYSNQTELIDYTKFLIIPSFSDLHFHASQYLARGLNYDEKFEKWFIDTIYKSENKYDSGEYLNVNKSIISDLIKFGVFNFSCFTSVNIKPSIHLMELADKSGLNAFVGKMNCDIEFMKFGKREDTRRSVQETIKAIEKSKKFSKRVNYILSPEFIPTISDDLMKKLGEISKIYNIRVQTHFSEGDFDDEYLYKRYPKKSYVEVLNENGLVSKNSLLVHGVTAQKKDLEIIREKKAILVHCASAYSDTPPSELVDISKFLKEGVVVGYGSDIGGSGTLNPFHNMIAIKRYNNIVSFIKKTNPIDTMEIFKIMTKNSGSFFGNYGCIEKGYKFSILGLETNRKDLSLKDRLLYFIYAKDITDIKLRYHNGKEIKTEV